MFEKSLHGIVKKIVLSVLEDFLLSALHVYLLMYCRIINAKRHVVLAIRWMLMTTFVRRPDTPQIILVLMAHTVRAPQLTLRRLAFLVNRDVTAQQGVKARPLAIVLKAFIALLGHRIISLWKNWQHSSRAGL